MRPKVVLTNKVHRETVAMLSDHATVVANDSEEPWPSERLLSEIGDAKAIMAFMPDRVDEAFLDRAPQLRLIACALKGFDNFDVEACTRRGIHVSVVEDLLTEPTAELTIGLMIGLARHVLAGDAQVRADFRGWRPRLYGTGLKGSRIGILGMGAIGRAIVQRLTGFGTHLSYWDRHRLADDAEASLGLVWTDLDELASMSDFLVCALPLTPETLHLVGRDVIRTMKRGAFLINPGRGSVVDEAAVAEAIEAGHLGGYAADVFEMEDWARADRPRAIHPGLLGRPDVTLFTPHLGSAVTSVRLAIEREAAANIIDQIHGRQPRGAINALDIHRAGKA